MEIAGFMDTYSKSDAEVLILLEAQEEAADVLLTSRGQPEQVLLAAREQARQVLHVAEQKAEEVLLVAARKAEGGLLQTEQTPSEQPGLTEAERVSRSETAAGAIQVVEEAAADARNELEGAEADALLTAQKEAAAILLQSRMTVLDGRHVGK